MHEPKWLRLHAAVGVAVVRRPVEVIHELSAQPSLDGGVGDVARSSEGPEVAVLPPKHKAAPAVYLLRVGLDTTPLVTTFCSQITLKLMTGGSTFNVTNLTPGSDSNPTCIRSPASERRRDSTSGGTRREVARGGAKPIPGTVAVA